MLYKNKIKVQNILKSAVALMLMLTLSLSTALSPLAKAEEAKYTWKMLTSVPVSSDLKGIYISPDGSKLFIQEEDSSHNVTFWMSADDGATWRKIFSKQGTTEYASISTDGSKIVLKYGYSFSISTDGGQSWAERGLSPAFSGALISPDGSFLAGCSGHTPGGYITYISTDDGQTWTQKGVNSIGCSTYVVNNGTLIAQSNGDMAKSTDYGQTWTETSNVLNVNGIASFSNNGNNIFDGNRISLDGGNHWTPSNNPHPASHPVHRTGISDDGKKLFFTVDHTPPGTNNGLVALLVSEDGGRNWRWESTRKFDAAMSNDGSKLFNAYKDDNGRVAYRLATLPTPQPVTPGSGAGGTVTPSTGSTSAALNQKPGKASGRLAETGTSTWTVGGLAVVAVAAGALVLRKRL